MKRNVFLYLWLIRSVCYCVYPSLAQGEALKSCGPFHTVEISQTLSHDFQNLSDKSLRLQTSMYIHWKCLFFSTGGSDCYFKRQTALWKGPCREIKCFSVPFAGLFVIVTWPCSRRSLILQTQERRLVARKNICESWREECRDEFVVLSTKSVA